MKKQKQAKLFSKKSQNKSKKKENSKKGNIQVVEQKEPSQKIEDILNHPISKRRLPPIEKRENTEMNEPHEEEKIEDEIENNNNNFNLEDEINNNIQNLNFIENENEEQIKDSLEIENIMEKNKNIEEVSTIVKNTVDNVEKKINIIEKKIKSDIGTGTPYYCDNLKDIKNEVDNKSKIISKLYEEQNNYKFELNDLFQKLNQILKENAALLYSDDIEDEEKRLEYLNELKMQLEIRKKDINSSKNQNKIYKQQYDILTNKEKVSKNENIEKKIDKIKLENSELIKQIKTLKSQSRKDGKKLEDYNLNGKYLSDINKTHNELKTLQNKKHEYFKKLSDNNKFINNCVKELENLDKFYTTQKTTKNYFNAKVEEEINRLKEDLSGTEEEIIKRIETDSAFIIRKMLHNEKMRENILRTPAPNKPQDAAKMKLKKGNNLEPLVKLKLARNNIHSGHSRRMNIVAKNKSPILTNINNNKEKDDFDPNKINYNDLTDFEFKEMINKKEHCYDVVTKLEKSIKEAQKMYQRKVKEIKLSLEQNTKKLNEKNKENEELKSEIDNLTKILSLTEQENKINTAQPLKLKKATKNMNKTNTNLNNNDKDLKELESQKEYLSPEYYSNNNNNNNNLNKTDKEKVLMPTHSNTDMTRNEILNDLKVLNGPNLDEGGHDSIIVNKNSGKISNFAMKFPDLSNIEENINVNINPNNEFERNKAIDDIKKKYNIKIDYNDNNDDDLNDELNLDEVNEEEKIIKEQERLKKEEIEERQRLEKEIEDEKIFFKEHEKILNNEEEGQFEPPIQNNFGDDNLFDNKKEEKDDNNENDIGKENEGINNINENENIGKELDNNKEVEEIKKDEEINDNNVDENKNNENNDDSLENLSEHNKEQHENDENENNEKQKEDNEEQNSNIEKPNVENEEKNIKNKEQNIENEEQNVDNNEQIGENKEQENYKDEKEIVDENNENEEIKDENNEGKGEIEKDENNKENLGKEEEGEIYQDSIDKEENENKEENLEKEEEGEINQDSIDNNLNENEQKLNDKNELNKNYDNENILKDKENEINENNQIPSEKKTN